MRNLLMSFILIAVASISLSAQAEIQTENFLLQYEVIEAKAVCWQTCRSFNCEEVDYAVFFDVESYQKIKAAQDKGYLMQFESNKSCYEETISLVDEHMPKLQLETPKRVKEIMASKGTSLKVIMYSNLNKEVKKFLDSL